MKTTKRRASIKSKTKKPRFMARIFVWNYPCPNSIWYQNEFWVSPTTSKRIRFISGAEMHIYLFARRDSNKPQEHQSFTFRHMQNLLTTSKSLESVAFVSSQLSAQTSKIRPRWQRENLESPVFHSKETETFWGNCNTRVKNCQPDEVNGFN